MSKDEPIGDILPGEPWPLRIVAGIGLRYSRRASTRSAGCPARTQMSEIIVRGWIELPGRELLDRAVAIVVLDDVTMIDSPAVRVAETVIEGISGWQDKIPFSLEVRGELSVRSSYVLSAQIRQFGAKDLRP